MENLSRYQVLIVTSILDCVSRILSDTARHDIDFQKETILYQTKKIRAKCSDLEGTLFANDIELSEKVTEWSRNFHTSLRKEYDCALASALYTTIDEKTNDHLMLLSRLDLTSRIGERVNTLSNEGKDFVFPNLSEILDHLVEDNLISCEYYAIWKAFLSENEVNIDFI